MLFRSLEWAAATTDIRRLKNIQVVMEWVVPDNKTATATAAEPVIAWTKEQEELCAKSFALFDHFANKPGNAPKITRAALKEMVQCLGQLPTADEVMHACKR